MRRASRVPCMVLALASVGLGAPPEGAAQWTMRAWMREHQSEGAEIDVRDLPWHLIEQSKAGRPFSSGGLDCKDDKVRVDTISIHQGHRRVCLGTLVTHGGQVRVVTAAHCAPDGGANPVWQAKFACSDPAIEFDAQCRSAAGDVPGGLEMLCQKGYEGSTACRKDIAACEVPRIAQCKKLPGAIDIANLGVDQPSLGTLRVYNANGACAKADPVTETVPRWPKSDEPVPSPIQLNRLGPSLTGGDSGGGLVGLNLLFGVVASSGRDPYVIPAWMLPSCVWTTPMSCP